MKKFEQNIIISLGDTGKTWLERLPNIIKNLSAKYHLNNIVAYDNLSYNYVASAYSKIYQTNIVLKIGFDPIQIIGEANTLKYYNGKTCVKLLEHDVDNNTLLLEKISPAVSLKSHFPDKENESIQIAANLIKKLHKDKKIIAGNFPKIEDWFAKLDTSLSIDSEYINKAKTILKELLESPGKQVLLHADLHHENILLNDTKWIAIDPKGVIGEIEYEVGAFIRPMPQLFDAPNIKEIIVNRVRKFATLLDLNESRIVKWSYAQAVLAACWSGKDEEASGYMLRIADIIKHLLYVK